MVSGVIEESCWCEVRAVHCKSIRLHRGRSRLNDSYLIQYYIQIFHSILGKIEIILIGSVIKPPSYCG